VTFGEVFGLDLGFEIKSSAILPTAALS